MANNMVKSNVCFRELDSIQRSYDGLTRMAKREVIVRWEMGEYAAVINFLRKPLVINW